MKNQTPDPSFLAALATCEAKALELRASLDALTASVPVQAAPWIATMTAPAVAQGLGAIGLLCDGAGAWMRQYTGELTSTLHANAPAELPPFADELAIGMARSARSCACGACVFCVDKARIGDDARAEQTFARGFRRGMGVPESRSRITIARG